MKSTTAIRQRGIQRLLFHVVVVIVIPTLPYTVESWLLPVSSPIMSLPIIEQASSTTGMGMLATTAATTHSTSTTSTDNLHNIQIQFPPFTSPTTTEQEQPQQIRQRKVFCDLDGVLVDFEYGVRQLLLHQESATSDSTTTSPQQDSVPPSIPQVADLDKSVLWATVASVPNFFQDLPWTAEGPALWEAILPLQPHILTGIPRHLDSAKVEKFHWCRSNLLKAITTSTTTTTSATTSTTTTTGNPTGTATTPRIFEHVDKACPYTLGHRRPILEGLFMPKEQHQEEAATTAARTTEEQRDVCQIITCWSTNKHYESGPGHVLIDDRIELQDAWVKGGGIFIHHRPGDLQGTLKQLEDHGLLPPTTTTSKAPPHSQS